MKRIPSRLHHYVIAILLCFTTVYSQLQAQGITQQLKAAFNIFENDPQLKYAISSLYVADAETGNPLFQKNGFLGLAPASTQKIITSVSAFELLGKDYRYETRFAVSPECKTLFIFPSGDPTFGSNRWTGTNAVAVKQKLVPFLLPYLKDINNIVIHTARRDQQVIPDGWIWQDLGNYYGAGAGTLNWRENQFDIILRSGVKTGDPVQLLATSPVVYGYDLLSEVKTAAAGSGDNAYVYFPVGGNQKAIITGTIPANENRFVISGALPDGLKQFVSELNDTLQEPGQIRSSYPYKMEAPIKCDTSSFAKEYTFSSPPLDSIIYWFNKKSINLYGEALIKTMAFEANTVASTDNGIATIQKLWKNKGLDALELNLADGSGLSPLNRVTTHIQVEILRYAKKQSWFSSFYQSLPEYNGMKMKSGTIRNVKGFCGYHRSKSGKEYVFSFLVNNYNGSASSLVRKMYKVLDQLK